MGGEKGGYGSYTLLNIYVLQPCMFTGSQIGVKMRRFVYFQGIIFFLIIILNGCGVPDGQKEFFGQNTVQEEVPIYFFHDTACGNCDGTENFLNIVSEQIAGFRELYPYKLYMYNVFKNDGMEAAERILGGCRLQADQVSYPAVLIHGKLYEGMDEIRENLLEAYLEEAESTAIYFFRTDCQECNDLKLFIDSLPETISINGTEIPFQLVCLDTREGDNREKIRELFTEYNVSEENQKVPFLFLKDTYLAGREEIEKNLILLLEQGHGLGFPCAGLLE